jgi:multiple sugar transport system permease protein
MGQLLRREETIMTSLTARKTDIRRSPLQTALKVLLYLFLLAFMVLALLPFVWMLSSSLKLDKDVFRYPIQWIPAQPLWDNYAVIWQRVPLMTYFKNTAIISLVVTFMQILTSSFAAYAFAKMTFKGRDLLFLAYIGTIAVPWQVYMLPQFIMMRQFGLYDTLWALIVLQSFSAFGVFLMRQFYMGIPNELSEAARIDGMSEYGIWFKIILPLSKPAIATLTIFTFVNTWNDYMGPLIYLTSDHMKTIQIGLRRFIQQYSSDYHLIMAASLCSLLPVAIVFLFLQKYFIEGIATTGIKG